MTPRRVDRSRSRALAALAVLFLCAAGVWLGWRWQPHGDGHRPSSPAATAAFPLAICDGTASAAEAVVTGEVRLHLALLPNGVLAAEELQGAVALQLRYAFASAQNTASGPTTLTPNGPPHSIEILNQKNLPYGNDLNLDWTSDPQIQPESTYVQRALARRHVLATDPAAAVAYRAQVGLAVCDRTPDSAQKTSFRFPVPHDPYLLYWHIGKEQRIMQVYGTKRARTFPCADRELADYDHPEYLWYFWQPQRKEPDCAELLPSPRVLGWVDLRIVQRRPPSGDFTRFKPRLVPPAAGAAAAPPLRIVLVFGYLNHQAGRPDLARLQQCLTAATPDQPQHVGTECAYTEWGAFQYGRFLHLTQTVLTEKSRAVRLHPDALEVELHGLLRGSGQRVTITAYLTETDFLGPPQYVPHHLPLLLAALREAEVVVYVGHSGLGSNFSVAQLKKSASPAVVDEVLRRSPVKVLGFIGCYSYSYFGRDFGSLALGRGGKDQSALFVYTGNAVEETATSALHILATLDCILQSADGRLNAEACKLSRVGDPARPDFLIYELAQ